MLKQDVKKGKAAIYTTVNGTKPQYYDIEILELRYRDLSGTRSMVIEITDPDLLSQTGGIVQGMSGSPIIQNGKLVGAVTHVFVNDPTRGYAIFAENMLETAGQVADENALKDAS
jgi:stage IV sporulation protein B